MNFVALDFETANYQRVSACQIGLVRVRSGKIEETFSSYINPVGGHLPMFSHFHGITPEKTKDAPTFDQLFGDVRHWLEAGEVISYTCFDKQVLNALVRHYKLPLSPRHKDACALAKARLPGLKKHRLPDVAEAIGLSPWKHHDALADAVTCAKAYEWLVTGRDVTPDEVTLADTQVSIPARTKVVLSSRIDAIFDDGRIDAREAVQLCYLLEDFRLVELPPFSVLHSVLIGALSDNVITREESLEIQRRLCDCIDAAGIESNLDRPEVSAFASSLS